VNSFALKLYNIIEKERNLNEKLPRFGEFDENRAKKREQLTER
jgi:hypothetical protein